MDVQVSEVFISDGHVPSLGARADKVESANTTMARRTLRAGKAFMPKTPGHEIVVSRAHAACPGAPLATRSRRKNLLSMNGIDRLVRMSGALGSAVGNQDPAFLTDDRSA